MVEEKNKGRWFLISCNNSGCESIFTINSHSFLERKNNNALKCPNCNKNLFEGISIEFDSDQSSAMSIFKDFLNIYNKLNKELPFAIKEISYEKLESIKNPDKPK